jgi:hypothetical protein
MFAKKSDYKFVSGIKLIFSAEFTPLGEDHAAEYFFASDARFSN